MRMSNKFTKKKFLKKNPITPIITTTTPNNNNNNNNLISPIDSTSEILVAEQIITEFEKTQLYVLYFYINYFFILLLIY